MDAFLILLVLAIIAFVIGFFVAAKWLFIVGIVLLVLWVIGAFRNSRF